MQSYFVWNNIDSRTMGLISKAHAPIVRPEERVQHVAIPGRSGDLTELEGNDIYNSYIQTVSFSGGCAETGTLPFPGSPTGGRRPA